MSQVQVSYDIDAAIAFFSAWTALHIIVVVPLMVMFFRKRCFATFCHPSPFSSSLLSPASSFDSLTEG